MNGDLATLTKLVHQFNDANVDVESAEVVIAPPALYILPLKELCRKGISVAAQNGWTPSSVMNNWGYSKLSRGDYPGAERMFVQAIRQDTSLFTAKNNLVLARGAQGNYTLPVVPMSQQERAELLYTLGLSAIKRGDVETGKGLFRDAIETHPQYFEAAVRSLSALENNTAN